MHHPEIDDEGLAQGKQDGAEYGDGEGGPQVMEQGQTDEYPSMQRYLDHGAAQVACTAIEEREQ
jgi:hypothetical protein